MGHKSYIKWDDDWVSWDNDDSDDDIGFFTDLDNYVWVPEKVGDKFSIKGFGYGVGRAIYEIIRIEDETWEHFNNVTFIVAGSTRDTAGYYNFIGFESSSSLRLMARRKAVIRRE